MSKLITGRVLKLILLFVHLSNNNSWTNKYTPCKAKTILKLNRGQLKTLIELITGQNNLNYMNNKVYGSEDLCRFCEEEEETFDHIINDCPCFYLDRCDLLQNQPIINTLDWDLKIILKFANIDTIKDALSYSPHSDNIWLYTRLQCQSTRGWAAKAVKALKGVGKSGA